MSEHGNSSNDYVTAMIGDELVGLPILRVQDVFMPEGVTRVPLAPRDIAGVLNLRGRIVTLIDMRRRLGFETSTDIGSGMAIGVESRGESYGLLIDSIGEVLSLKPGSREPNPLNLDAHLARVSLGIHRLEQRLLMVLDVDRILDIEASPIAA
jgi:purine-binding chemotaxis protein CheW